MAKEFTKGPWKRYGGIGYISIDGGKPNRQLATVWENDGNKDAASANAKLIAAAPDLLAELIHCVNALEATSLHAAKPIIEGAKKIIDKATN